MRAWIRCLVLGAVAIVALRHLSGWDLPARPPSSDPMGWWGALSFALAAVVDTGRGD